MKLSETIKKVIPLRRRSPTTTGTPNFPERLPQLPPDQSWGGGSHRRRPKKRSSSSCWCDSRKTTSTKLPCSRISANALGNG